MAASDLLRATLLAGLVAASPLHAGTREFKRLVRDLRTQCHTAPMGTGFLSLLARCFSPHGVSGLRMAIFQDPVASRRILGADLEGLVQASIGTGMAPMVRMRSPRTGERTLIYAAPEGREVALLIVTLDPREVAVFSLRLDPKRFQAWLDDPGHLEQRVHGQARPRGASDPQDDEPGPVQGSDPGGMR